MIKILCALLLILTSCASEEDLKPIKDHKIFFEKQMQIKSQFSSCSRDDLGYRIYCLGVLNSGEPIIYWCEYNTCTLKM